MVGGVMGTVKELAGRGNGISLPPALVAWPGGDRADCEDFVLDREGRDGKLNHLFPARELPEQDVGVDRDMVCTSGVSGSAGGHARSLVGCLCLVVGLASGGSLEAG